MTLRAKLVATYIGLAVVGAVLYSLFATWLIKNHLERRTEAGIRAQVQAIAAVVRGSGVHTDSLSPLEPTLQSIARALGLRLTMIARDGTVLFDSDIAGDSLARVENHLERPEIQSARRGGTGLHRRRSASVNEEFLYAASAVTQESAAGNDTLYVRAAIPSVEITALDSQVQTIVWGIGLVTVALMAVVSARMSRRISRPILSITAAAQGIRDGDLTLRVPVSSNDEIGTLAAAINGMAEKLSNDIQQLKKLERMRSEFLGNVSHELRTPIFSLQGFLETLLDGAVDDPAVNRDFLEKAYKHATRLNALLSDLIEISRIESGEMKMSFRYVPLMPVLKEVFEELTPAAKQKAIGLTLEPDGLDDARVYADEERLKQVVINLLDNAIKYTDPGGRVVCRARKEGEYCAVDVEDTGCGIPQQHIARIFERFYRVDRDRSREVGGTGLGLAIVKHIVEAHGGTLRVRSEEGKGSTFTFVLRSA